MGRAYTRVSLFAAVDTHSSFLEGSRTYYIQIFFFVFSLFHPFRYLHNGAVYLLFLFLIFTVAVKKKKKERNSARNLNFFFDVFFFLSFVCSDHFAGGGGSKFD